MGDNLTLLDAVKFASAYGAWLLKRNASLPSDSRVKVVLGRDARISGKNDQQFGGQYLGRFGH